MGYEIAFLVWSSDGCCADHCWLLVTIELVTAATAVLYYSGVCESSREVEVQVQVQVQVQVPFYLHREQAG